MSDTRRIVVLISGSGSNLQALINAHNTPALPQSSIVLVLSNRKAAYGLTRAKEAGIPTAYLAMQPFLKANPSKTRDDYDEQIARIVLEANPDVVVLAGWMHIVGLPFLHLLSHIPVINLHPALPGAFDGANAIERAYEAFERDEITHSGIMVHRVIRDVDRGEPIIVREIRMVKGESLEDFQQRLHKEEWDVIVKATKNVLDEVKPI